MNKSISQFVWPLLIMLGIFGYEFKLNVLGVPISGPEILTLIMLIYIIVTGRLNFKISDLPVPVLLVLLAGFISVYINQSMLSLGALKGWVVLPVMFFFAYGKLGIKLDVMIKTILAVITLFVLACVVSGLLGYGIEPYFLRLRGPFMNPNYLGMLISPVLVCSALYVLHKRPAGFAHRSLLTVSILILLAGLMWSQSYASISACIGALLILIPFFADKSVRKKLIIISLAIAVVIGFGLSRTDKFSHALKLGERSSSGSRIQIWRTAGRLLVDHPVFGIGPRQFQARYIMEAPKILGGVPYETDVPHPHNQYLDFYLSYGLMGFVGFMTLIWGILSRGYKIRSMLILGIFVTLAINGLFDTWYSKIDLVFMFWLYCAISFQSDTSKEIVNTK